MTPMESRNVRDDGLVRLAVGSRLGGIWIEPTAVYGVFVVHPRVVAGQAVGPDWTVTHAACGLAIWHAKTLADARRVASWLASEGPIPVAADKVATWAKTMSSVDRKDLLRELLARAPRSGTV